MLRTPKLVHGCDIRSLPLGPAEAYLLSRIDAVMTERDLALITGLPAPEVTAALDRLHRLGAIEFSYAQESPTHRPPPPAERFPTPPPHRGAPSRSAPPPPLGRPVSQAAHGHAGHGSNGAQLVEQEPASSRISVPLGQNALSPASSSPTLYDPGELDEDVELEPERKRRILDLYYRLDNLTHYELLAISEQSDKKQIKSAYYALAPEFHPDTYFRKRLGSYQAKIEAIFSQLTLAHDVLTNKQRRPVYDEYLEQSHRNRTMETLLEQAPRDVAAVASAVEETAKGVVQQQGPSPGRYAVESVNTAENRQARREAFARKIAGKGFRRPGASAAPAAPEPPPVQSGDMLRARYEHALHESRKAQIKRHVEIGRTALDRKEYAAAANSYRIAASLDPDDKEMQDLAAHAQREAAAALAEGYLKQAEYEMGQERWLEAALSFSKVCAGRPEDAAAHERVAFATLKSGGNVRRAVDFGRRAVELAPSNPDFRFTLARAYVAAGFEQSARGEVQRAVELAPKNARIKALAAEVFAKPKPDAKPKQDDKPKPDAGPKPDKVS
jgi:curved DNA-binding protein CbpA